MVSISPSPTLFMGSNTTFESVLEGSFAMRWGTKLLTAGGLLLLAACTRTIVVQGPDRRDRGARPPPRTAPEPDPPPPPTVRTHQVPIPPGHLPSPGQCRVWIPG